MELTSLVRKTTTLSNMSSWLLARTTVSTALLVLNNSSLSLSSVVSLVRLIVVVLVVSLVAVRLVSNVVLRGVDRHQQAITQLTLLVVSSILLTQSTFQLLFLHCWML